MKKYILLSILFILLGIITQVYLTNNKSDKNINNDNNLQVTREKVIDKNSLPPVNETTNPDENLLELDIKKADKLLIKGKKHTYSVLLPGGCVKENTKIICTKDQNFSLEQIDNPNLASKPFTTSETYPTGDYKLTIKTNKDETLFIIKGEETIYLLAKGANYTDISNVLLTIISTFSADNLNF